MLPSRGQVAQERAAEGGQVAHERALRLGEENSTGGVQAQGAILWMAHFASRTRRDAAHDRDAPVLRHTFVGAGHTGRSGVHGRTGVG